MDEKFFIGIDSGGTKTEVLIKNAGDRTILGRKFNSVHYSIHGTEKTIKHLKNIISVSLKAKKLKLENCAGICIGLAGARESKDRERLRRRLSGLINFKNILFEPDSVIALNGAFNGKDGMILICGTGSILFGLSKGKFFRIGGWGRVIGDHGSGYEIGKAALQHLTREYDHGRKLSVLSEAIERKFSFSKQNLIRHIYHKNFDVQKLVPLVLKLAESGDKDSLNIVKKAADDLMRHIGMHIKGSRKKTALALSGSILENDNILSRRLKSGIRKEFGNKIKITNNKHTPCEGAVIMAKNKFGKN